MEQYNGVKIDFLLIIPTLSHPPIAFSFEKRYDNLPPADAHLQKISDHVSAYLAIVKGQLLATVPKAIVHCMVRHGRV